MKVSCLQSQGVPGDIAYNLAEIDRAAAQAKADGADLLITPEMFLTGYDCGPLDSLLRQGYDLQACLAELARHHGLALLVGLPREMDDGSVGNSAIFLDDAGNLLGEHVKSHLYGALDEGRFRAGSEPVTIVEYRGVRTAILICMEIEFPEPARLAAIAGADFIAVLTANMAPYVGINEHLIWARAWENQTYVAYVNRCGSEGDTSYVGLSSIYGPSAELLSRAGDGPALISADIAPRAIVAAQESLGNNYLAERRPELYAGLVKPVDSRPHRRVTHVPSGKDVQNRTSSHGPRSVSAP